MSATWRPQTRLVHGGATARRTARPPRRSSSPRASATSGPRTPRRASPRPRTATPTRRVGNPTVRMLEERMALLEGSEDCAATASGMAAVHAALMCQLRTGMRVVGLGPAVRLVPLDPDPALPALRDRGGAGRRQGPGRLGAGLSPPGRPRVPRNRRATRRWSWWISPRVAELAHRAGAKVIVDNVFATPLLQQPLQLGADIVVYSATKHIDGQGRCLGGLICCDTAFRKNVLQPYLRNTGPGPQPVQRLGAAQGAGDPGACACAP